MDYVPISLIDLLAIVRVDEWEDRDGHTPMSERVDMINGLDDHYKELSIKHKDPDVMDIEVKSIIDMIEKYPKEMDCIAVVRLIRYFEEIKDSLGDPHWKVLDKFDESIFADTIPVDGKREFLRFSIRCEMAEFLKEHSVP